MLPQKMRKQNFNCLSSNHNKGLLPLSSVEIFWKQERGFVIVVSEDEDTEF